MNSYKRFVNNILFAFVAVLALQPQAATAQQASRGCRLRFFVCRVR